MISGRSTWPGRSGHRPAPRPSGIYWFRVPEGRRWQGAPVAGVEIIQFGHRYGVVWPSIHPDGPPYGWWIGDDEIDLPGIDDARFTWLSDPWAEAFTAPDEIPADYPPSEEHREADWTTDVRRVFTLAVGALADGGTSDHEVTRKYQLRLVRLEQAGHAGATAALEELEERFIAATADPSRNGEVRSVAEARAEWRRLIDGGRTKARTTEDPAKSSAPDDRDFWTARPELERIHIYAQAQMASPWAVLAGVLARITCQVPPAVVLPAIIHDEASLNLTLALVGRSGDGKGGSVAVARRAVDIGTPAFQIHTLGSGQGIAHGYGHWENGKDGEPGRVVQHATSVMFNVEEVDHLAAHNNQNGSTALAELRRFCMGEKLGHLYVDRTKRIEIPDHHYRGAIVVGVQPARAGIILNDADGGTPQRFTWWPTIDHHPPDIEPERPEPLRWELPRDLPDVNPLTGLRPIPVCSALQDAVREARRARNRGEGDPLDGHALLTRERWAAALGLLSGHWGITDEDAELAGRAMAVSDATRAGVVVVLEAAKRAVNVARGHADADREEVIEDRQDQRVARRLLEHLRRERDWITASDLRRGLTSRDRPALESAIEKLIAAGQAESELIEAGHKQRPGTRYRAVGQ